MKPRLIVFLDSSARRLGPAREGFEGGILFAADCASITVSLHPDDYKELGEPFRSRVFILLEAEHGTVKVSTERLFENPEKLKQELDQAAQERAEPERRSVALPTGLFEGFIRAAKEEARERAQHLEKLKQKVDQAAQEAQDAAAAKQEPELRLIQVHTTGSPFTVHAHSYEVRPDFVVFFRSGRIVGRVARAQFIGAVEI